MIESSEATLEKRLADFWKAGEELDSFVTNPAPPEFEGAILKRLGKPPEAIGGLELTRLLERAYSIASKAALNSARNQPASKRK